MILNQAITPRAFVEENPLPWEQISQWFQRVFSGEGAIEASRANAEHLSPVAAAHRILTNSFGLIPFGLYRKDGDARVPVDDPYLNKVLKERANDYMSPFMLRKIVMSNAFWWGFGAVWNRIDSAGHVIARIPLPTDCCTIRKDADTGTYWYDYSVDGFYKSFANSELSFLYFETYDGTVPGWRVSWPVSP